jgi:hypothetical protein
MGEGLESVFNHFRKLGEWMLAGTIIFPAF